MSEKAFTPGTVTTFKEWLTEISKMPEPCIPVEIPQQKLFGALTFKVENGVETSRQVTIHVDDYKATCNEEEVQDYREMMGDEILSLGEEDTSTMSPGQMVENSKINWKFISDLASGKIPLPW